MAGLIVGAALAVAPAAHAAAPVTPAGFRVAPVGTEFGVPKVATGFQGPMGAALSPDGTRLLAASSGASRYESADLFDLGQQLRTSAVYYDAQRAPGESAFYGVAWARQPATTPFGDPGAPENGANAPMAAESATWNWSREDATPEVALNQALWKSVKGKGSAMPRPKHTHIIGSRPNDEDDD